MKVGIITMHKAISYGSALQAYALQRVIEKMGFNVEIIDYKYPNNIHKDYKLSVKNYVKILVSFAINMLFGFSNIRKLMKFKNFWKHYYNLSSYYPSEETIKRNPPLYDIYITGSDQVWNANFTKSDTTFLLSFAKGDKKKISYSSSFAVDYIPDEYVLSYKKYLSEYKHISVRENTSRKLLKSLLGKDVINTCDPTLLLSKEEWNILGDKSKMTIHAPYILVFMLGYSFNPFPEANYIINSIQERLKMDVVCLDGDKSFLFHKNTRLVRCAGPCDFVKLVKESSYVITSSFHGVVFSTIFNKPFTAIVNSSSHDSRLVDYLKRIKLEEFAMDYRSKDVMINSNPSSLALEDFVSESKDYLKYCLAL